LAKETAVKRIIISAIVFIMLISIGGCLILVDDDSDGRGGRGRGHGRGGHDWQQSH